MTGRKVFHDTYGSGTIVGKDEHLLIIDFKGEEMQFVYPDAFQPHLSSEDQELMAQVNRDLQVKHTARAEAAVSVSDVHPSPRPQGQKKRKRVEELSDVAFKCNYCNEGKSQTCIGFHGVCSDGIIRHNIKEKKRAWCSDEESPCRQYLDGEISRDELEAMMEGKGYVCYEGHMLRDWTASVGENLKEGDRGKPRRLLKARHNNLAVLTSRSPKDKEYERFVFAVFLVDESYEGDNRNAGYVTACPGWRIALTPQEAGQVFFWDYYFNPNAPDGFAFGSGLFRYLSKNQAAQILRKIARIRTSPEGRKFARRFFEYYCTINGIDPS